MRDVDKLTVLEQGVKFLGEEHRQKLPVYIKNKLIFRSYFKNMTVTAKKNGLFSKQINSFLKSEKIFELKVQGYAKLFDSMKEHSGLLEKRLSFGVHLAKSALGSLHELGMSNNDIAKCYLGLQSTL